MLDYVYDLSANSRISLERPVILAWLRFQACLESDCWPTTVGRNLTLEPHAQDRIPEHHLETHVDVAIRGVDARCSELYHLSKVTGVDSMVQAVVAAQIETVICLLLAVERIEENNLHEFSFVCKGATHRSVACCMLLAAIVYPEARVRLTTPQTQRAATDAGLC